MLQFVVRVDDGVPEKLRAAVKPWAAAEAAWWSRERSAIRERRLAHRAERQELAALRRRREQLRAAGVLRGTQSALVSWHLRAEFAARGWADRQWRPIPAGAATVPGRPIGRGRFDGPGSAAPKLAVELDDELGEELRRIVYWVSRPARLGLQRWRDRHGIGREATDKHLRQRDELRAKIVTTGDVLRDAIARAVHSPDRPDTGDLL